MSVSKTSKDVKCNSIAAQYNVFRQPECLEALDVMSAKVLCALPCNTMADPLAAVLLPKHTGYLELAWAKNSRPA